MTNRFRSAFRRWRANTQGVTAVEYGLIAAGLAVAISGAVFAFGESLRDMLSDSADRVAERPE